MRLHWLVANLLRLLLALVHWPCFRGEQARYPGAVLEVAGAGSDDCNGMYKKQAKQCNGHDQFIKVHAGVPWLARQACPPLCRLCGAASSSAPWGRVEALVCLLPAAVPAFSCGRGSTMPHL